MRNFLHASLTRQVSIRRLGIPTGDGTLHCLTLSSLTSLRISKPYTPLIPHSFSRVDLTLSPIPSTRNKSITITSLPLFTFFHCRSLQTSVSSPRLMQTHTSWLRSRWNPITIVLYPSYLALSLLIVRTSFPLWKFFYRQSTFSP